MPSKPFPPRVSISGSPSPTTRAARNAQRRRSVVPSRSRLLRGAAFGRWRGASAGGGLPWRRLVHRGACARARGRTRVADGAARNPGGAARAGRARAWLAAGVWSGACRGSPRRAAGCRRAGPGGARLSGGLGAVRPAGPEPPGRRDRRAPPWECHHRVRTRPPRCPGPPPTDIGCRAPGPASPRRTSGTRRADGSRGERGAREGRAEGAERAEKRTADYGMRTMRRARQ